MDPINNENVDIDSRKVYKVSYSINMLSSLGEYVSTEKGLINKGTSLISLCCDSDELDIFESENFKDLILFKWDNYGFKIHMFGCIMHLFYIAVMLLYVDRIYIKGEIEHKQYWERLLIIVVIYPACYDWIQLWKTGIWAYFSELQNYSDLIYIYGSIANVIL